jgi:hypothetical protein
MEWGSCKTILQSMNIPLCFNSSLRTSPALKKRMIIKITDGKNSLNLRLIIFESLNKGNAKKSEMPMKHTPKM